MRWKQSFVSCHVLHEMSNLAGHQYEHLNIDCMGITKSMSTNWDSDITGIELQKIDLIESITMQLLHTKYSI